MTLLGYIFIPLGIGVLLFRPCWLLPLAIIAAVFQAGSVLNIGDFGLSPYYFVSILMVLYFLYACLLKPQFKILVPSTSIIYPLVAFWAWASVSAIIMPLVFGGMPILVPSVEVESLNDFPIAPLHLSFSNAVQIVWLTLNVVVVLFAARFGKWEQVRKAFSVAVAFAVTVFLVQLALNEFGYQFPEWIFHSNPGQNQAMLGVYNRPNGLFSEPSIAGVLVTALTAGALAAFLTGGSIWLFIGSLICALLVRSAASLVALAVCCAILCVTYFPARKSPYLNLSDARKRYAILGLFVAVGATIILTVPSINEALAANTVNKADTTSFFSRTAADFVGLTTFYNTYGLGVGIGSIRTSSFLVTLLATTGFGAFVFIWFVVRLLRRTNRPALRWMFLGGLLAQVAGVPELSLPLLWMNASLLTVFILRDEPRTVQDSQ